MREIKPVIKGRLTRHLKTFILLLIALCISGIACKRQWEDNKAQKPKDLIPRDKMVAVLTDFHLIESALLYSQYKVVNVKTQGSFYYKKILDKYHITKDQFDRSLDYYSYHLKELESMYEEIIVNYTKMEDESARK